MAAKSRILGLKTAFIWCIIQYENPVINVIAEMLCLELKISLFAGGDDDKVRMLFQAGGEDSPILKQQQISFAKDCCLCLQGGIHR